MDIRQLRYFIAIVEEGKISAAAERLHISQPPLSQHLKAMEEELGTTLVERSGKQFEVTEAGKSLYKYALQMVQLMEEAKLEAKEAGNGVNGQLKIGVNTFSVAGLSELLQTFGSRYPKVTYKIQQNESAQLCQLVRDRAIELAIIRLPLELSSFSVLHLKNEPFYFIASAKHERLKDEVSLADIHSYPLVLPSTEGLGVHYLILEAFSRSRLTANLMGECSDIALLMDMVSSGFCASVVPETVLKRHKGYAVNASKVAPETDVASPIGLIWLKHHRLSQAAQNFVDLLQSRL
ncbi:LysR family transcriptional regulator [Cohnella sp. CIP 111063]|uniref:LysR family transcriptional regulator n=1 Tax=unclassified Cohnella TaxID=2636738 RepID=UPI000B8BB860|nr:MULTISPECIES: LysR family transcriptional regulator [unclassified Cohnella]OXS54462.1 LysR family transcriptional regulator [Cohnella sp. CIP 111063]PRX63963.1 DNA-binding transcriptional LysR family regulator [Cohnella sp. SGD-V74]